MIPEVFFHREIPFKQRNSHDLEPVPCCKEGRTLKKSPVAIFSWHTPFGHDSKKALLATSPQVLTKAAIVETMQTNMTGNTFMSRFLYTLCHGKHLKTADVLQAMLARFVSE